MAGNEQSKRKSYRCTVCDVETMSSKMCPRCGRRSTLVETGGDPADRAAVSDGGASGAPGNRPESRKKLLITVVVGLVTVIAVVGALAVALFRSGDVDDGSAGKDAHPSSRPKGPRRSRRTVRMAPDRSRRPGSDRPACGQGYCLQAAIAAGSGVDEGAKRRVVHTTHCFMVQPSPTESRWWYLPVRHTVSLTEEVAERNGAEKTSKKSSKKTDLLRLDENGAIIEQGVSAVLGVSASELRRARPEQLIGKRMFYLQQTRHGFTLASAPSDVGPLEGQMLAMAMTAASMMPAPPGPDRSTWTDSRPLPPLMRRDQRAPARVWRRAGPSPEGGRRFEISSKKTEEQPEENRKNRKKNKKNRKKKRGVQPAPGPVTKLSGQALTGSDGRTERSALRFELAASKKVKLTGSLRLQRKERICVR